MSNKSTSFSQIGKEILQALEDQRLTKKFLYEKLDISRGTLDNWIYGITTPDHNEVQKIYDLLHINVQKHTRTMRDIIEDENYIGMHKRVYDQLEENWLTNRDLLRQAMETIRNLTSAARHS
jgi:transcriptional regulator with XRE-family HTH domain